METMRKILLIIFALIIFMAGCVTENENLISVTVSIDCGTISDNYSKLDDELKNTEYVPDDGVVLPKTQVKITKDATVLDVLKAVTKEKNIQLEYTQSVNDSYVEGINFIYEFSCGDLSGWMYKVNGEFADRACSSYIVRDSDVIEWVYTCDLGKDLGNNYKNGG